MTLNSPINILSLFSGIGAPEKALSKLGIDFNLVNYCEIDKYASRAYSLIHKVPESKNLGDITKVDTSEITDDIDLLFYGFPCTDISIVGDMKGFEDENGNLTRSGLFFEALRIIQDTKPKYAIAENVKNLMSKSFERELDIVLNSLGEAGYNNYCKILNAKDYGIPQSRERVFIVSIRKDVDDFSFNFPKAEPLKILLRDLLEDDVDSKYYLKKTLSFFLRNSLKMEDKGNGFTFAPHIKRNATIARAITTKAGSRMDDNFVIDIGDMPNIEFNSNLRIRMLTPRECFRLMGFDDRDVDVLIENGISNTQLYKMAGNSIVVDVLERLFECLLLKKNEEPDLLSMCNAHP